MPERIRVQRKKLLATERETVQRAHTESGSVPGPLVQPALSSPGRPIDAATRALMEPRFGYDFSQVRFHTDGQAAESAESLNARAYTVGGDVVFGAGRHAPETSTGQRLIAHELAHVVQQSQGPVSGTPMMEGMSISHPEDRFEQAAEQAADRAMAGQAVGELAGAGAAGVATLQRAEDEPEEEPPPDLEMPEEEEEGQE